MNKFLRKFSLLAMVMLGASIQAVGAEPGNSRSAVSAAALYEGADRQARLIEAARKEGMVTVYTVTPPSNSAPVISAFEKKYGIKVNLWRASSDAVLARVITEGLGGKFDVDIIENNTLENEALHREKLLQEVRSPYVKSLLSQASAPHKEWVGTVINVWIAAYNTDKVKKEELPKSYQDFLDPKWKGRLGIEANNYHWFATLANAMGEERALKVFENIVSTNGISMRKGHSLLAQLVSSGEVPMALTVYNWNVPAIKSKGGPIEGLALEPVIGQFRTVALHRNAPHPNAAVLFYDFMLNEGQQILAGLGEIVPSKNIDSPYTKRPIEFIDPDKALDMSDKWKKTWDEVIVRKSRQ
jgi:iron(III) transport system substrate-binding protein